MNIYAQRGSKVEYLGENGYERDREDIEQLGVKVGDILTVDYTDIGSWCTYVHFSDLTGSHNSVMFEDYDDTI